MTIVNVGHRSTKYWVVSAGRSRLLVDIGWPGALGTMKAKLDRMDVPIGSSDTRSPRTTTSTTLDSVSN